MSKSISLHKQHGIAPALTFCRICGGDTNEIALLGAQADKVMREVQRATGKPQRGYEGLISDRIPSDTPCDTCLEHLNNRGTIIIAGDTHEYLRLTGEQVDSLIHRVADAKGRILDFDAMRGKIHNIPKAFWVADGENIRLRDTKEWTA
jgi:hypothetical protein